MKEKDFENKVKKYLKDKGAYVIKHHGGYFSKVGVPDLLICYKGKFLGVELKGDNGKPSPLQLHNIDLIKKSGGIGIILYPNGFKRFKELVEGL